MNHMLWRPPAKWGKKVENKMRHEDLKPREYMIDNGDLIVRDHDGELYLFLKSKRVYPMTKTAEQVINDPKLEKLKVGEFTEDDHGELVIRSCDGSLYWFPDRHIVPGNSDLKSKHERLKELYAEACEKLKKAVSDINEVWVASEAQTELNNKLTEELNTQINLVNELQKKIKGLEKTVRDLTDNPELIKEIHKNSWEKIKDEVYSYEDLIKSARKLDRELEKLI